MDEKTAKGPGFQLSAPTIRSGIDRKLHRLARPADSGVSTPTERPRDAEAEARGQRSADAEAGGLRSGSLRSGGLRSESLRSGGQKGQIRSPNQEVLDQRGQDLSWRINR